MLLAVMDLGSNSFKMTVAQWAPEISRRKPFRVLHKERHPIQLGASVFSQGRISKEDFKKAVQAIRRMHARLRDFASPILRVVATSAIRDASNGKQFVEYVRKELGIHIEVISGKHEASLIARGLSIEYPKVKQGLLIDIGGGSTEIAFFGTDSLGQDKLCRSYKVGSVRVESRFFKKGKAPELAKARRYIKECFKTLKPQQAERLVGSAGTIQSLGEILANGTGVKTIYRSRLEAWIKENFLRSPKQLEKRFDLRPSRARVIVPGALVLLEAMLALKKESLVVTGMTLRDGLMVDLVENWLKPRDRVMPETAQEELQKGTGLSKLFIHELESYSSKFGIGSGTARHIAYLANTFYIQLTRHLRRHTHAEDFRCLTASAFFYYCGRAVSEKDFEQHSSYIVENADLRHLNPRERKIVARIVLFSRNKAVPAKSMGLWGFDVSDTQRIFKLTALFRLAVALDEIESQNIMSAQLKLKKNQLLVRLVQRGPSRHNDFSGIRDHFKYFEQVFGLKIVTFIDHQPAQLSGRVVKTH